MWLMSWLLSSFCIAAPVAVDRPAPPLKVRASKDQTVDLSELRGKVVVVNFWASWCGPCVEELPLLDALHDRISEQGGMVVAVNLDRNRPPADGVIRRLSLDLVLGFDPTGATAEVWAPRSLPASYLIDKKGHIREVHAGVLDEAAVTAVEARIQLLLVESR